MPKTIAITPSWYWPTGIPRVVGIPPFSIYELCVLRPDRDRPDDVAVIDGGTQLTYSDLRREVERRAGPLALAADESRKAVLAGDLTLENVLQLLAGLAGGVRMRIAAPGSNLQSVASAFAAPVIAGQQAPGEAVGGGLPPTVGPGGQGAQTLPAITLEGSRPGELVNHSNRSLLAMAISMSTFVDAEAGRPWLVNLPLSRWEGLMGVVLPFYLGAPLVLPPARRDHEELIGRISKTGAGYVVADLEEFAESTKEAKKTAKDARRVLAGALLATRGPFDPDHRRRVSKGLECPALTFWGMPETGPVFASHASWYMDESIGIPMTNAHVVPSDPRTGQPIAALWELVESAEVTVFSPSLAVGYEGAEHPERVTGGRLRTGMIASSDANGMIYLLGM